jgi:Tfp pilus assembly protein PilO
MVILAAAAVTAAGVGAYRGGKAVAEDVKKKVRRNNTVKARQAERNAMEAERARAQQIENVRKQNMSVTDRVERFKKGVPEQKKTGGLFRKSQA